MRRTQIQLPESLYREIKRVAELQEWSIAEVLRRGAEYVVRCYPKTKTKGSEWLPPAPRRLGAFKEPASRWREVANEMVDDG